MRVMDATVTASTLSFVERRVAVILDDAAIVTGTVQQACFSQRLRFDRIDRRLGARRSWERREVHHADQELRHRVTSGL
jgi:hypothetical protein